MNTVRKLTVAAAVLTFIGSFAVAQELKEITVQATRALTTKTVGRDASTGASIIDVSLSYRVKIDDLDLASNYGPIQLEKRIRDVATSACQEIGRKYPNSTPSDQACIQNAVDKAMVKAHELEAVAKASAK